MSSFKRVILAGLLTATPLLAFAQANGTVNQLFEDPLPVYEQGSDGKMTRTDQIAASQIALPLPILERSPKGYLLVEIDHARHWLRAMNVGFTEGGQPDGLMKTCVANTDPAAPASHAGKGVNNCSTKPTK